MPPTVRDTETGYDFTFQNKTSLEETNEALKFVELLFRKSILNMKVYIAIYGGTEFISGEKSGTIINENGELLLSLPLIMILDFSILIIEDTLSV